MSIHDFIKQYERMIIDSASTVEREEELLDKLDDIENDLLDLENEIEDEREIKEQWEYIPDDVLADEFNYTCRALGV